MEISHPENPPHRRLGISASLIIRLINETIEKIRRNASLIVLPSREETLAATLTGYLEQAGIPLQNDESGATLEEEGDTNDPDTDLPPLNDTEIKSALDLIPGLSVVEKVIFADDLGWLTRKSQEEFIDTLKHCK